MMDIQKQENVNLRADAPKETAAPKVEKTQMSSPQRRPKHYNRILFVVLVIVLLGAVGAAYYFCRQSADLRKNSSPSPSGATEQAKDVIAKVSRLMILPLDEEPTVATVSEPEKLKDQPFFANAKVGDKVLIYSQAKKAILYDPIADKIVEVAPLNIGSGPSTQ